MAADKDGNYIVAAVSSLLRVTPSGAVSEIAATPSGSQWIGVAVDSSGNYILGDNVQHSIWRVSPDGRTIERAAVYPVRNRDEIEDIGVVVAAGGDYLVMEDNFPGAHFWRISPSGGVTPIALHGDAMMSGDALIAERDGSYLVASFRDRAVFRVTAAGEVTKFASVNGDNLTVWRGIRRTAKW